ncbi:MAG: ACT domain-containing protein [Christensenellales bacterium]|jgi:hypothetical protein
MFIRQISVFIENRKGRLAEFCRLLGEHEIDMIAITIADTTSFGILRAIVDDTDRAVKVLREANYAVTITEVLAVAIDDRPGGLAFALEKLRDAGISVEYLYSFVRHIEGQCVILLRVDDPTLAVKALKDGSVRLLSFEEIIQSK